MKRRMMNYGTKKRMSSNDANRVRSSQEYKSLLKREKAFTFKYQYFTKVQRIPDNRGSLGSFVIY